MKAALSLLILSVFFCSNPATAQKRRKSDSVDVTIRLNGHRITNAPIDSVFIFFDKYDHTGAGIIKQVYYPKNNSIFIPDVPEGRYFIAVYCLGAHMQYFSEITFINKKRSNNLEFDLNRSEQYIPGSYIPEFPVDFTKLSITDIKSFR